LANRTAQLYKYIKLFSERRDCKAVFYPNNRIKPHAALTPDKPSLTPARSSAKWMAAKRFSAIVQGEDAGGGDAAQHMALCKKPSDHPRRMI